VATTPVNAATPRVFRAVAVAAGLVVGVVGGAHLATWLSGAMEGLGATTITMKANASLSLMAAGLALSLLAPGRLSAFFRLPALASAVVVLTLGALTLSEHLLGIDLGIDQVLATEPPGAAAVLAPNRMGPPASLSFTLLGVALLLLTARHPHGWLRTAHQPIAIGALLVALLPALGYVYGADQLYGVARYTGIAWPTAACLLVLALGVLLARPEEGFMASVTADSAGGMLIRRLLPATVLLPLGVGWLRLAGERASWFDPAMGTALAMLVFIVTLSVTVLLAGRWVTRSEAVLRESEEATRRQLAEIQAIYDSAHIGLCVLDRDLRYVRVNRRLAEINGLPASEHLGKSLEEVVPGLAPVVREFADRMFRTGEGMTDLEWTAASPSQPGGQRILLEQWLPLKDASGNVTGINVVVEEVTERRRAEAALRHSEERLKSLVRASSQVMYRMDPDWTEMIELEDGRVMAAPKRDWLQEHVHPDDRPRMLEAIAEARRTGTGFRLEHRVLRAGGTVGWTSSRAVPVRDASGAIVEWFGAASDITPRREAEDALRKSENRLATALEIAALGIWDYDAGAGVSYYDERCRGAFGLREDRALPDADVLSLVHPDDRHRVQEEMAAALDPGGSGLFDTEYRIARPDGSERWVAVRGHAVWPPGAAGPPVRLVGTLMDITERRRAEEALRQANLRLAEADRRKDEFIAIISHELRNPLAPIRFALPLLEREALAESAARAVAVIARQVDHLARLVDEFFDVSRLASGQIELRVEDVTVESMARAAIEAASPAIVGGRHVLTTMLPEQPIWIKADPRRITQVLTNLLNNSAKYTPSGGQIRLEVERDGGHAVFRDRDSGMGIAREALPTLFEMFRQVKRADKPQGGLGIGLAFARRLVEMHGGTIEADSAGVGQGSVFVVRLPAAAEISADEGLAAANNGGMPGRRLKVLVVDDNADLVQMLAMVLEGGGHDVRKALDGRSAVTIARAYLPDVVLLDLGLPVMDGLQVAQELRRHPETAKAFLVALTGWGQPLDRHRTKEAGFDCHLTKPTDPQTLQQVIADFAAQARSDAGSSPA